MELVHRICCGLDVHKKQVTACLRSASPGEEPKNEVRRYDATVGGLEELAAWLMEAGCEAAAMESTGVYWKPVYHVLSRHLEELLVGNAREIRPRPGRKTDKADAKWIAELLAHGLIRPSFVPPPGIQALRDLTRTRATLVRTRTAAKNRVQGVLEDTNIKLGAVVSDLFGKSGRLMLQALMSGEGDPKKIAQLAKGTLRRKLPELELALRGCFTAHHGLLIGLSLDQIDLLDRQIDQLDAQIKLASKPIEDAIARLSTVHGLDEKSSAAVLAETGVDMTRFGSDQRLASWAGLCPGNNESAGKRHSGKTPKGNKWLKPVLVQCAWAARQTESHLGRTFYRLEKRIGQKKAAVAVAHKILVIVYHLLLEGTSYDEERYARLSTKEEQRRRKAAVRTLERLGYKVDLQAA